MSFSSLFGKFEFYYSLKYFWVLHSARADWPLRAPTATLCAPATALCAPATDLCAPATDLCAHRLQSALEDWPLGPDDELYLNFQVVECAWLSLVVIIFLQIFVRYISLIIRTFNIWIILYLGWLLCGQIMDTPRMVLQFWSLGQFLLSKFTNSVYTYIITSVRTLSLYIYYQ
jgi:hypothetical protein